MYGTINPVNINGLEYDIKQRQSLVNQLLAELDKDKKKFEDVLYRGIHNGLKNGGVHQFEKNLHKIELEAERAALEAELLKYSVEKSHDNSVSSPVRSPPKPRSRRAPHNKVKKGANGPKSPPPSPPQQKESPREKVRYHRPAVDDHDYDTVSVTAYSVARSAKEYTSDCSPTTAQHETTTYHRTIRTVSPHVAHEPTFQRAPCSDRTHRSAPLSDRPAQLDYPPNDSCHSQSRTQPRYAQQRRPHDLYTRTPPPHDSYARPPRDSSPPYVARTLRGASQGSPTSPSANTSSQGVSEGVETQSETEFLASWRAKRSSPSSSSPRNSSGCPTPMPPDRPERSERPEHANAPHHLQEKGRYVSPSLQRLGLADQLEKPIDDQADTVQLIRSQRMRNRWGCEFGDVYGPYSAEHTRRGKFSMPYHTQLRSCLEVNNDLSPCMVGIPSQTPPRLRQRDHSPPIEEYPDYLPTPSRTTAGTPTPVPRVQRPLPRPSRAEGYHLQQLSAESNWQVAQRKPAVEVSSQVLISDGNMVAHFEPPRRAMRRDPPSNNDDEWAESGLGEDYGDDAYPAVPPPRRSYDNHQNVPPCIPPPVQHSSITSQGVHLSIMDQEDDADTEACEENALKANNIDILHRFANKHSSRGVPHTSITKPYNVHDLSSHMSSSESAIAHERAPRRSLPNVVDPAELTQPPSPHRGRARGAPVPSDSTSTRSHSAPSSCMRGNLRDSSTTSATSTSSDVKRVKRARITWDETTVTHSEQSGSSPSASPLFKGPLLVWLSSGAALPREGRWMKCWVVATSRALLAFSRPTDPEPFLVVALGARSVLHSDMHENRAAGHYFFGLQDPAGWCVMAAPAEEQRARWAHVIAGALRESQGGPGHGAREAGRVA